MGRAKSSDPSFQVMETPSESPVTCAGVTIHPTDSSQINSREGCTARTTFSAVVVHPVSASVVETEYVPGAKGVMEALVDNGAPSSVQL